MTSPRVIKKYPNRRLYDSEESRYITLTEVRDLVLHGAGFVVIEKRSGRDITRTILLQIIMEQEQHGEPIMSEDFLAQVIRAHGKVMVSGLRRHSGAHSEPADDGAGLGRRSRGDRQEAG